MKIWKAFFRQKQNIFFTLTLSYLAEWCTKFSFLKTKKHYKYINFVKIKKSLSKHISLTFINFWMRHKCIPSIWTTLSLINNKSFFFIYIFSEHFLLKAGIYFLFYYLLKLTLSQRIMFKSFYLNSARNLTDMHVRISRFPTVNVKIVTMPLKSCLIIWLIKRFVYKNHIEKIKSLKHLQSKQSNSLHQG